VPVNVDAMNRELMERSLEAWDAMDRDRWIYNFDTEDSIVPDFEKRVGQKTKAVEEEDLFRMLGDNREEEDTADMLMVGSQS
jgi:hypothetical protein